VSTDKNLLFVYGTLKRTYTNHHFLADQEFIGEARTAPGFRLFDLGGYPGLAPHTADRDGVVGEVWSVDPEALARLDVLEGLAEGLYRREAVQIMAPYADRRIEAYFYNRSLKGRPEIGGIWRE